MDQDILVINVRMASRSADPGPSTQTHQTPPIMANPMPSPKPSLESVLATPPSMAGQWRQGVQLPDVPF